MRRKLRDLWDLWAIAILLVISWVFNGWQGVLDVFIGYLMGVIVGLVLIRWGGLDDRFG